jgi:hypothetical protein
MDGYLDSSEVCGSWELYPYEGHETTIWSTMDVDQYRWLSNNSGDLYFRSSGRWSLGTWELHLYEGYEVA